MLHRFVRTALVAACAAALLSGCAPSPAATPTPTPHFTSEAQAFAAAEATYRAYVDALNQVDLQNPATFEEVYRWTTGPAQNDDKKLFTQMHADGWKVAGKSEITLMEPAATDSGFNESVKMAVCLDVSAVDVVDEAGISMVDTDRGRVQRILTSFSPSKTSPTGWLMENATGRSGAPECP